MSFKPEFEVFGELGSWHCNNLAFATFEEAEGSAHDLACRWMMVNDWRAVESDQPVNCVRADGRDKLLPESVARDNEAGGEFPIAP